MASVPLFREEEHPRADDGKFTDKGGGSSSRPNPTPISQMTPRRREALAERMGRKGVSNGTNLHPEVRKAFYDHFHHMAEVERRERDQGYPKGQHGPEWDEMVKADYAVIQKAQMAARADEERQHSSKLARDRKWRNLKERQDRVLRELEDLELHLDNLEERYADREGGSITEMKFPDEESKREFDELRKRRDELEKLYDQLERRKKRNG